MALEDIRIVLVEPKHPGNIGAVARAMKTMSLTRLILVRPNDFPSFEAERRAAGADDILKEATVLDDLGDAVADCRMVVGCTARNRARPHPVLDARQCAVQLLEETSAGEPAALLFGTERTGLERHHLDRCNFQLLIPANEQFSSLNLASAVQLVSYELFVAARDRTEVVARPSKELPAREGDMEFFYQHLIRALDSRHFLDGQMRVSGIEKLRRLIGRSRPNDGELKLLHSLVRLIHRDGE